MSLKFPVDLDSSSPTIVIVGAGIGGLLTAIALKRQWGFEDFVIFERAPDIGGTWRDNTYPGCASDIQIHWYCFSTDLKPDWKKTFGSNAEIQGYLLDVTSKYSIRSHCQFNTSVVAAEWDPTSSTYHVTTENVKTGERKSINTKVVISATGVLCEMNWPKFEGLDKFKGSLFHSARWDHSVELKGKRVAVIGNGCSAAQFVPIISEDPSVNVVNFCRTAMWYQPRPLKEFSSFAKWVFAHVPLAMRLYRLKIAFSYDKNFIGFRSGGALVNNYSRKMLTKSIKETAPAQYHDRLIPDYPVGCKRIIFDPGYLEALHRPNLDLNWSRINHITEDGIVLKNGEHLPFDVIIYATGFTTDKYPLPVRGRAGQTVDEYFASKGGPTAYLGTTLPGFPNFCILSGPNTVTGHASVIYSEEIQVNYILQLIKPVIFNSRHGTGVTSLEPTAAATDSYNTFIQSRLSTSVFAQCTSWYRTGSDGKIFSTFPGALTEFWWWCRRVRWDDYIVRGDEKKVKLWQRKVKLFRVLSWLVRTAGIVGVVLMVAALRRLDSRDVAGLWGSSKTSVRGILGQMREILAASLA